MTLTDLISTNEAAAILGKTPNTVRDWVRTGKLPPPVVINATTHRHRRQDVEALAAQQKGGNDHV